MLDLQTRQLKNLTNHPAPDVDPSWSPDGSRIVFVSFRDGLPPKVYIMNPDRTGVENLKAVAGFDQSRPIFSPNGKKILFGSEFDDKIGRLRPGWREIYIMNTDGSDLRNLTQNYVYDKYPVWSPDGSQIAFASSLNPSGIHLIRPDGTYIRL